MIVHESEDAISKLSAWWRAHARGDIGPFGQPEWVEVYRRHFGGNSELRLLELHSSRSNMESAESNGTAALIPMELYPDGVIRFAGGTELTDYAGPVCEQDMVQPAARALAKWLSENRESWNACKFEAIPEDWGFGDALAEGLATSGFGFTRQSSEICAVLDLPADFDTYLASLAKKERHELRRKWNRFGREVGKPELIASETDTIESDLPKFFEWHRQARGSKGGFMSEQMESYFSDVAQTFSELGMLRLEFVEVGNERYAASFGFCDTQRRYLYNSAYRQDAGGLSPGMVLFWLMLQKGLAEGVSQMDFLQGDERYKFQLGAQARRLETIEVLQ